MLGLGLGLEKKNCKSKKIYVLDGFNRDNSTTTLGKAETGQSWTALQGVWGINGNSAYTTNTSGFARAVIDAKAADGKFSCTLKTVDATGTGTRLLFRLSDVNNEWFVGANTTAYELNKRVAGTLTPMGSYAVVPANGDKISVVCQGSSIKVYINGVLRIEATDTFNQTATKFGLCTYSTSAPRFDDFKVVA